MKCYGRRTTACECRRLTLVVDGIGDHRAEVVFPAVVPLQLTLETEAHSVHVHVLDALRVSGWRRRQHGRSDWKL